MKQQSTFRKYAGLFSLGYMGGTIYLLMYVRYCFYDQMIEFIGCTNAQLGFFNTICSIISFPLSFVGAYLSDKLEAKSILIFSIGGMTLVTFVYAMFCQSYAAGVICFIAQALVMTCYWATLIKYINNLGGEDEAGNSYGVYYLINGLSGAFGNIVPVYFSSHFGFRAVIICYGVITLVATILVILFLDNEKTLAAMGRSLKGDEPINIKHVPLVLKWPGTYIIFLAYFTTYTVYCNVSYFNPYLVDVIGIDPDASSIFSVIRSYGAMVVAPIGGIMCDKVFKSTSTWYIVAFCIIAIAFAIPLTFSSDSNATFVCIYSVCPSIIIFSLYAVTYSILRELHIPQMVAGTAIGIGSVSGTLVDGVWPVLFGSWLDKFGNNGYTMIFIALILDCVLGILNALWSKSHDKKCKAGLRVLDTSSVAGK